MHADKINVKYRYNELVALWPGPGEPTTDGMNLLLTPIVQELQLAYQGNCVAI